MPSLLRTVLAVVAGVVVATLAVTASDALVGAAYPLPPGTDLHDMAAMKTVVAHMPALALLMLAVGWSVATAIGSYVAVRLTAGRRVVAGVIVTAFLLAATIMNLFQLSHPAWVWVLAIVLVPALGWLGARLAAAPGGVVAVPAPDASA